MFNQICVTLGMRTMTFDNTNAKNNAYQKLKLIYRQFQRYRYIDIVMSMYNLSECNDNYSMTSGSLWSCCREEINDE